MGHTSKLINVFILWIYMYRSLFLKGLVVQTFKELNIIALFTDYHKFIEFRPTISLLFFNNFFHLAHGAVNS